MRGKNSGIVYDGWFEFGDVIRQELKGPKGEGSVIYPNGDHFEGFFHLNYAHIYGPAYAADGNTPLPTARSSNTHGSTLPMTWKSWT